MKNYVYPAGLFFCIFIISLFFGVSQETTVAAEDGLKKPIITPAKIEEMRKAAAHRQRRMIFNNDGNDAYPFARYPSLIEGFLKDRTTPLVGSQADTIFYCTTAGSFGFFTHRTKVGEMFLQKEWPCGGQTRLNFMQDFLDLGTDPLQVIVDFCRKNKIEVFWSNRMNDIHDSSDNDYAKVLFCKWKQAHPECLVGSRDNRPPHGSWGAVDYARPEVRDLVFRFFEEVCRNYAVDGVEMDFCRHMTYFKSVAWGGKASQAELDMLTDLLRRIRKMADEEGIKRGRPILIAARLPDSVEYCRAAGLDLERWLSEGLLDIMIPTGYFQLNPWGYSVNLGHKYGIPVYPCLAESRVQDEAKGMLDAYYRNSNESYRARAMQVWQSGADGIYMFNFFSSGSALWRELGDTQSMLTKNKTYFVAALGDGDTPDWYLEGGNEYINVPVFSPDAPFPLLNGQKETIPLLVGEDLTAADKAGFDPVIKSRFLIKEPIGPGELSVKLNGNRLEDVIRAGEWLEYAVAPQYLKKGENLFEITAQVAKPVFEGDAGTAQIKSWDMDYVCRKVLAFPEQLPWRRLSNGKGGLEQIQFDNQLVFADRGTGPDDMINLIYPWSVGPDDTAVVEARLRVVDTNDPLGVCIRLANNKSVEYLLFGKDRIGLQFAGLSYPMDTTGALHTYRVVLKGQDIRVYVDGQLRLDGRGKYTTPSADKKNWLKLNYGLNRWNKRSLLFGSATGPGTGEACWEYIRFASDAKPVYLRDLMLSVKYVERIGGPPRNREGDK